MLVRLENPNLLSRVIEIISDLVTEVRIKVNEEGLSITAMDPANVSLVRFMLSRHSFSQFETDEEVLEQDTFYTDGQPTRIKNYVRDVDTEFQYD